MKGGKKRRVESKRKRRKRNKHSGGKDSVATGRHDVKESMWNLKKKKGSFFNPPQQPAVFRQTLLFLFLFR